MPEKTRQKLYRQVTETPNFQQHGFKPCPFLEQDTGHCGVYPVRPMGCRGLLATKKCQLDVQEDTGFELTVGLMQQAWKDMPVRIGELMLAQEQHRKGKGHTNLNQKNPDVLVQLKQLEPEKLAELFDV